ncbi:MAG: hypothetical protein MJK04_27715, partial [Psychrosphaera sp.]|nr:hypothetical protein [Psychrosphaera sp.]
MHKLTLSRHPFIKDVCIDTHQEKKHIIITGQNGVGKSTFLGQVRDAVKRHCTEILPNHHTTYKNDYFDVLAKYNAEPVFLKKKALETELHSKLNDVYSHGSFCELEFNSHTAVDLLKGNAAVQAFFNAKRTTKVDGVRAVETAEITPQKIDHPLSHKFKQHLVNSRSQLAFARYDGDENEAAKLEGWFTKLDEF